MNLLKEAIVTDLVNKCFEEGHIGTIEVMIKKTKIKESNNWDIVSKMANRYFAGTFKINGCELQHLLETEILKMID